MDKRENVTGLIIGLVGSVLGLFGVKAINTFLLMSLPIGLRMIVMIVSYWLIAIIPIVVMRANKDKLSNYGFQKERLCAQILIGIAIGLLMSIILTLIPHLAGFGEYVDNGKRYKYFWQFIFEFIYCIFAIGCVEEFVFRGFVYNKIATISKESIAIIGSSLLFGAFHFLNGNFIQMIMTAFLGMFFCLIRNKIKYCTTVSIIIAHGVYDALITVLNNIFI